MPSISTTDAQGIYTKFLIDVYKERVFVMSFLRSFFATDVSPTLELSIEVQRGSEKIAVDVMRGSEGNRNDFSRSTEKIFIPPYFREFFDMTTLQLYDRLWGATSIDDAVFSRLIEDTAEKIASLQDKIERAYELQCAQVFETGIVTLVNGINIDFKRKAGSKVDLGAGNYWASAVDPKVSILAGCQWLRKVGKAQGGTFNLILGTLAMSDLLNNDEFKDGQNLFNLSLDAVAAPQRLSTGANFFGELTAGSYKVRLWTYDEYYEDASGNMIPYVNPKIGVLLPERPKFKLGFAAVPQLLRPNTPPKVGAFVFGEYIDDRAEQHIMDVKSSGLAIPTQVDGIYTMKVVA